MIDSESTVEEAQAYLKANIRSGVPCPCCKQLVKLYKRKLNAGMARALILFYKSTNSGQWIHISNVKNAAFKEYSKLKFWGLIEPNSKVAGEWRLTDLGRDFVEGRAKVKSHVGLYDRKCLGLTGLDIDITWSLGEAFNFNELMRGE